jgi:hypothetical protein
MKKELVLWIEKDFNPFGDSIIIQPYVSLFQINGSEDFP